MSDEHQRENAAVEAIDRALFELEWGEMEVDKRIEHHAESLAHEQDLKRQIDKRRRELNGARAKLIGEADEKAQ